MKQLLKPLPVDTHYLKDLLFDISPIGDMMGSRSWVNNPWRQKDRFVLVWVVNGYGSYCISDQKGIVANNQLLFIKPGEFTGFKLTSGLEGYVISFTTAFCNLADKDTALVFNNLYHLFNYTTGIEIDSDTVIDMHRIVSMITKEIRNDGLHRCAMLKQYFNMLMICIARQIKTPMMPAPHTRDEEIVNNFTLLVERDFKKKRMVSHYAGMLSVTPSYLNEVIKKRTAYPAGHHIRQRVAREAQQQALYGGTGMKAVAYDLGFLDTAHFSKFFKKTTGVNFSEFKKSSAMSFPTQCLQSIIK